MVEIGVEGFSLGDIHAVGGLVVVSGQKVVDIVQTTRSLVDFREVSWPDTSIGVFGL